MTAYSVFLRPSAEKELRGVTREIRGRIRAAIDRLQSEPRPRGCVALSGFPNTYRIRVGDYRVVYELDDGVLRVLVIRIAHRRESYRRL